MVELGKRQILSLKEVSTLAMTDALTKLSIEKALVTEAEFLKKLIA